MGPAIAGLHPIDMANEHRIAKLHFATEQRIGRLLPELAPLHDGRSSVVKLSATLPALGISQFWTVDGSSLLFQTSNDRAAMKRARFPHLKSGDCKRGLHVTGVDGSYCPQTEHLHEGPRTQTLLRRKPIAIIGLQVTARDSRGVVSRHVGDPQCCDNQGAILHRRRIARREIKPSGARQDEHGNRFIKCADELKHGLGRLSWRWAILSAPGVGAWYGRRREH
jgi:hypothetical protein